MIGIRFWNWLFKPEKSKKLEDVFTTIYHKNEWGSSESISGPGSEVAQTENLRNEIQQLIGTYAIKSILDVPCGDFNWMKEVDLSGINYVGGDIVKEIIEENMLKYPTFTFQVMDITTDPLPKSDLLIVRDCCVHFNNDLIVKTLENIKKSEIKYLLITSFPNVKENVNIVNGQWRPINMELEPFNLKNPIYNILEHCTENDGIYADKSLLLVKMKDN